jgi:aminopeptidase YwaD
VAICFRYEPMDRDGRSLWARAEAEAGGPRRQWTQHADLTRKIKAAADHGAVAVLFVNPPGQDNERLRMPARNPETMPVPVMHISADTFQRMLRGADRASDIAALRDLQRKADRGSVIEPLPGLEIRGEVKLEHRITTTENVIGVLPGRGRLRDEVIVIGAHYDHLGRGEIGSRSPDHRGKIHPGADDNASGTAGLLLLAERFSRLAKTDTQGDRRTLVFAAFTAEERGLLGSRHMTRNLDDLGLRRERIVAMLNMDMIGRLRNNRIHVSGVGSAAEWRDFVEAAARHAELELRASNSASGPSDHASFYAIRVPVLHFFTGVHAEYHTPQDTADTVNFPGAVKVVDMVDHVARALLTADKRLTFQPDRVAAGGGPGGDAGAAGPGGASAYLGLMPDYGEEGDGLRVAGVMPGTPAEKAGLRSGDIITRWNDEGVGDIHDLTRLLRAAKPGDKVSLQVTRDETLQVVTVELGQR